MKDRWWQHTPRRPGLILAMATLVALAISAGITAVLTAGGGPHRPLAAGAGLGAPGVVPSSSSAAPASPGPAGTGPARTSPGPSGTGTATARPAPGAPTLAGVSSPAATPPGHQTPPVAPTSPRPPPPPSPSPSVGSPAPGYLLLAPDHLMLTSKAGQPVSGFFVLTAASGPVAQYTVRVAADSGRVRVAPASGSLVLNGFVEVTVTVTSKTALSTQVVVEPGNLSVTVVYKPKPAPAPSPSPSPSHGKGGGDGLDGKGGGDG